MYQTCAYCGRLFDPHHKEFDPHGCFGCSTRTLDLSGCGICRSRLPITAGGRRYLAAEAVPCGTCGAPTLPSPEPAEAEPARERVPALAGFC